MSTQDKPWEQEPDLVRFEAHGLECLILRVKGGGHLCGYVQLPEGHPWRHGFSSGVEPAVHGGITWEGPFFPGRKGEPPIAEGYWIGFDCAHSGDRCPHKDWPQQGEYRNIGYVTQQTTDLARQAQESR